MSLWGNKDLVYSAGQVQVNLGTSTAQVTGTVGLVTFTTAGINTGNVITVGAGATYGYAVITGFTSTTLSIASTAGIVTGITTVPSTDYFISEEPIYTLFDSVYRAPESKTVGYSTSPVFTGVFGVDANEVGVAATTPYSVTHSGWVGIMTYIDTHGNLRVKSEVLVAGGINITAGTDASDDEFFPDPIITILTQPVDVVGIGTTENAVFTVVASVNPSYAPLTYQWQEDGSGLSDGGDYSGVTTPTLTVVNNDDKDDGREYTVEISSGDSSQVSTAATITYA